MRRSSARPGTAAPASNSNRGARPSSQSLKKSWRSASARSRQAACVQTHVTETPVREHVILHEEHINVERRPADRDASREDLAAALKKGSIEVRETAEEAVVAKKPKVVEEVVINKEGRDRTETVEDTVRRTDVDVKQADTPTKVTDEGVTKEVKAHPKKS